MYKYKIGDKVVLGGYTYAVRYYEFFSESAREATIIQLDEDDDMLPYLVQYQRDEHITENEWVEDSAIVRYASLIRIGGE